ncbi:hypothetical protein [Dysgonomonas mossii]|uniref:hypothetical protein n=1 Tax=Dysgonomonas mossii TaxID=163665 RepID=UPI0039958DC5
MKYLAIIISIYLCLSCAKHSSNLTNSLELAIDNRVELEKVLSHYSKDEKDSLKYKAAVFLIENMSYNYSFYGVQLDSYYRKLDSVQMIPQVDYSQVRTFYYSIFQNQNIFNNLQKREDLKFMQAEYLIKNIDQAFKYWQTSNTEHLSFDEFCEYILPYRIGNEPLEDWRHDYSDFFKDIIKETSNKECDTDSLLLEICMKMSSLYKAHSYYNPIFVPDIKPSSLRYIKIGPCQNYVNLFVYFARAFGIPVSIDFTPQWANNAMGHEWAAIHAKNKILDFVPGEENKPGKHLSKFDFSLVKVYRRTYSSLNRSLNKSSSNHKDIPPFFLNTKIIDVTKEYIPVIDISITNLCPFFKQEEFGYLSVFNNKDWVAVDQAQNCNEMLTFKNVGYPSVFLPVSFRDGIYTAIQYPVLIDKNKNIRYLKPNVEKNEKIVLKRKYKDNAPQEWVKEMKGGFFELSNNQNFYKSQKIDIPCILECNYQRLALGDEHEYKYIRYIPPKGGRGAIAEISILDSDSNYIEGTVIGTYPLRWNDSIFAMEKAFDRNPLSYAAYGPDQPLEAVWIGLKFNKSSKVKQIEFLPRNDDNFIKDEEVYELFYWDNKWISLGRQVGSKKKQYLEYFNAPSNALFLLKNQTKGKEERIFTYEEEKQVWW